MMYIPSHTNLHILCTIHGSSRHDVFAVDQSWATKLDVSTNLWMGSGVCPEKYRSSNRLTHETGS